MSRFSRILRAVVAGAGLSISVLTSVVQAADPVVEPLGRPALLAQNPQSAFMTDADRAGATLVAVGERGLVLLTDDGQNWRQGRVPVSTGLTAVSFADTKTGMAVGHGGVILGTSDGGESWIQLLDGRQAAQLALQAARQEGDERAMFEAQRLVDEGPDKPFLDLLLLTSQHAIAVGAYGLAFETLDAGQTWQPIMSRMANPDMSHIYAIRINGERIVAVGEFGLVMQSLDRGASWQQLITPYSGSFFTLELPSEQGILVAGLKGTIWQSQDLGDHWESVFNPVDASITSSQLLPSGDLILGSQAGLLLRLQDQQAIPLESERLAPVNAFQTIGDRLIVLTMDGIRALKVAL